MTGLLRKTIVDALGGETEAIVDRISQVLHAGSLLNHAPPPHAAAAVLPRRNPGRFRADLLDPGDPPPLEGIEDGLRERRPRQPVPHQENRIVGAIEEAFDRLDALAV